MWARHRVVPWPLANFTQAGSCHRYKVTTWAPSIPPRECPMVAMMVMAPSHPMDMTPNANRARQERVVVPDAATQPCTLVILPTNLLVICDTCHADDTMMFITYY